MINKISQILKKSSFFAIVGAILVSFLIIKAPVRYARSDPQGTLLTSQLIIKDRTIYIDKYIGKLNIALVEHAIFKSKNNHFYYSLLGGTSIFSIPSVWIANLLGKDMAVIEDDIQLQILLIAIICALVYFIIYMIGCLYISSWASLVITTISFFGSSLISTMGTGLWNMDYAVLFEVLSILYLVLYGTKKIKFLNPYLLGCLLFGAYFSRPTAAPFVFLMSLYIFIKYRQAFIKLAATLLSFFLIIIIFSKISFNQWLPFYFQPDRIWRPVSLWAIYINLLSPSRGIFIFSPFFAIVLLSVLFFKNIRKNLIFWLSLSWFFINLLVVGTKVAYWGGHCYGSRLLTDAIPALVLVTFLLWNEISRMPQHRIKNMFIISYILLGILGIFINTNQGLYNTYTVSWNPKTNIDKNLQFLSDWRFPQFLVDKNMLTRIEEEVTKCGYCK